MALTCFLLLVVAAGGGAYALGWVDYWRGTDGAKPTPAPPLSVAAITPGSTTVAEPATERPLKKAAVRRALAGPLHDKRFGGRLAAWVAPLEGAPVVRHGDWTSMPASTTKLLTTAAALEAYEPTTRFGTTVTRRGNLLTLVGGGDPLLDSAGLRSLAKDTAEALQQAGVHRVRLGFDTSLFAAPSISPRWRTGYVPEETVPITPLVVDRGHLPGADGKVGTLDDGYTIQPAKRAVALFRRDLAADGITVTGTVGRTTSRGTEVAHHDSDTLAQIVEHTLKHSDNLAAEFLARHVALLDGKASFASAARAVEAQDVQLGIDGDDVALVDGSGLSRQDRIAAPALVKVLQLAASDEHPELRPIISGLPMAGFDGSLSDRFFYGAKSARGYVRAKTGTLTGAHALAGIVRDKSGTPMVVALLADRVPDDGSLDARNALDDAMAGLARCACS